MTSRSRPLELAFRKGSEAFYAGEGLDDCPYKDHRTDSNRLTWSRAFRNAWRDGWLDAQQDDAVNHGREP